MFNPENLIRQYNQLADGKPKLEGIKLAIKEADNNKDYHWALYFREEYIKESVFEDDSFNALIMFPEYMALFDSHPELQDSHQFTFMIRFKWIIENITSFYQISKEQVDKYFEEFKNRCNKYGYSLRSYYMKHTEFYKYIDMNIAKADFEQYKKSKRDSISDCYACDTNTQVSFELDFGDIKSAIKTAKPILNGTQSCAEVPQVTYGALMYAFTKLGQFDEALHYASLVYKQIKGDVNFLSILGDMLILYSLTDINKGLDIFKNNVSCIAHSKNPNCNFHFYNGAYRLFKSILPFEKSVLCPNVPKSFPIYNDSNVYDVSQLMEYFYNQAKDLAIKFDTRNGTNYFMDLLSLEYKPSNSIIELPKHINTIDSTPSILSIPISQPMDFSKLKDSISTRLNDMRVKLISLEETSKDSADVLVEYYNNTYTLTLKISEKLEPLNISNFKHQVLKKDFEDNFIDSKFKYSVVCSMDFQNSFEDSYHLQIKLLCALGLSATCIFDVSRNTILSYKWAELCAYSDVPPVVDYLVNIEIISNDNSDTVWLYTKGLSCMGIRELEMIGVKSDYIDHYYQIMMFTVECIFYNNILVDEKQPIVTFYDEDSNSQVTITWKSTDTIMDSIPPEICGSYKMRDSQSTDTACILLQLNGRNKKPLYMWELPNDFIENVYCPNNNYKYSRINKLAFERFPILEKLLQSNMPCNINVTLEALLSDINNEDLDENSQYDEYDEFEDYETIGIRLTSIDGNMLTGYLLHDISTEDYNYSKGDTISINIEYLQDWNISFDDGLVVIPDTIYMIMK